MNTTRKVAAFLALAGSISGWASMVTAESLKLFAEQCDAVIGPTVPDFNCDNGTLVPTKHLTSGAVYPHGSCDRPNRLNEECDPGSRFTVLTNDANAFVVAHCRKKGGAPGKYGDIAVIQHNKNSGATCFYQSKVQNPPHPATNDGNVKAPLKGSSAWPWMEPSEVAANKCVSCHDNGPIIRSPYLAQLHAEPNHPEPNALPGAGDSTFNSTQPYGFVGEDFASWKAYKVEVDRNNICMQCHRLGVSNLAVGLRGTALDFGMRATARSEVNKNLPSSDSPMWMPPGHFEFNQNNANAAEQVHDCALRVTEDPLPNSDSCRITLYTHTVPRVPPPKEATSLVPIYYLLEEDATSLVPIYYLLGM